MRLPGNGSRERFQQSEVDGVIGYHAQTVAPP